MINIIPNQPLAQRLQYINRQIPDLELQQLVQADDIQKMQVTRGIIEERSYIANSSFAKAGGMAGSGTTLACTGSGNALATSAISAGKTYEVSFRVLFNATDNTGGYRVKLNDDYLPLADASGGAYSIIGGNITLYYYVSTLTTTDFLFDVDGADTDIEISGISITRISDVRCDILAEDFSVLNSNPFTIATYSNNNLADITIDWSLCSSNGIRYLHVADNINFDTELLTNSTFATDVAGWTNNSGGALEWIWSSANGGEAQWPGSGTNSGLSQTITAIGGSKYDLVFTTTGLSLGSESVGATIYINGTVFYTGNVTLNGSTTYSIDLSDYENQFVTIKVTFRPGTISQTVGISGVSLKRKLDVQGITVPCKVLTNQLNTHLLYGTNTGNAFGFYFNRFYFKMRVRSRKEYTGYPDTTDMASFSDNSNDLTLSYPEKKHTVTIYGAPEYAHDCIRLMRLCDTFTYDGTDYVQAGEYSLKRTEHLNMALAQFDIKDKTGVERNTYSNA